MKIELTTQPNNQDIDFLTEKINDEKLEFGKAFPFAFFIRNENMEIIAGCNGSIIFGTIYTDQLWVHPNFRSQGLGRRLMESVHNYGVSLGCRIATACTMDFQEARKFYEALGYEVDFERSGYIKEAHCLFLRLQLQQ